MNEREMRNLDQAIRQLIVVVNNNTAISMAALPQFYTLDELCTRYKLGKDAMRTILIKQGMIVPERGKPIRVAIHDVLRLDKMLTAKL